MRNASNSEPTTEEGIRSDIFMPGIVLNPVYPGKRLAAAQQ
jgi:hypothetical protein